MPASTVQRANGHPKVPVGPPLPAWQRVLFQIGLFTSFCLMLIGFTAVFVISDKKSESWLANTKFGELWRYLMTIHSIFLPGVTMSGVLGSLLCGHNLQYDSQARSAMAGSRQKHKVIKRGRSRKID